MHFYTYQAQLDSVVDGDTARFTIDYGFDLQKSKVGVRPLRIDTAEIYGTPKDSEEFQIGREQFEFICEWFQEGIDKSESDYPFVICSEEWDRDSWARVLGTVTRKCDGLKHQERVERGLDWSGVILEEYGDDYKYEP